MSTHADTRRDGAAAMSERGEHRPRRLSTETGAAFKTTEFFAYVISRGLANSGSSDPYDANDR